MENKKGRYQITVNPLETNGLPASLYFTSKFAEEVGSEFIADFENPVNADLVCKRLNDYAALAARCDRYEKALKEIKSGSFIPDDDQLRESKEILRLVIKVANEALNGVGEKTGGMPAISSPILTDKDMNDWEQMKKEEKE